MYRATFIFLSAFLLAACGAGDGPGNTNSNTNDKIPVCGDGILDSGEQCDDGEANSDTRPNACRTNCRNPYCGDMVIDADEECEGSDLSGNSCMSRGFTKGTLACSAACTFDENDCTVCGDGVAEGTDSSSLGYETCDGSDLRNQNCLSIGQAAGVLACNDSCGWDISGCVGGGAVCGNGVVEEGELCDDGNNDITDACPDGPAGTCIPAYCGDGFIQAGSEGCDDGNGINEDICPDGVGGTCQIASCGDGFVFTGTETCDTAVDPYCHPGCTAACGDGNVDSQFGERCDDGNNVDDATCYNDCSGYCGDWLWHDGVTDVGEGLLPDHGEECDTGGTFTQWCNPTTCKLMACGDGNCDRIMGFETHTHCPQDCPASVCGDGNCDPYEETFAGCPQDCPAP